MYNHRRGPALQCFLAFFSDQNPIIDQPGFSLNHLGIADAFFYRSENPANQLLIFRVFLYKVVVLFLNVLATQYDIHIFWVDPKPFLCRPIHMYAENS